MRNSLMACVTALCALGLLGGCLILARSGFTASAKRSEWHIFVPAPQAYIMAAIMFALSGLALLWLLQQSQVRARGYVIGATAYLAVAALLTYVLSN